MTDDPGSRPRASSIGARPLAVTTEEPLHVVVVDDRPDRRHLLVEILRTGSLADAEVSEADAPAAAVELVGSQRVDGVLVEVAVPGAIDLIADLRRQHPTVPIVVCSFVTDPATRERATAAGATAFLAKPVTARQLERALLGPTNAARHPSP